MIVALPSAAIASRRLMCIAMRSSPARGVKPRNWQDIALFNRVGLVTPADQSTNRGLRGGLPRRFLFSSKYRRVSILCRWALYPASFAHRASSAIRFIILPRHLQS